VVNESKTEIMWIGKDKELDYISVNGCMVKLVDKIKALGIYLDGNLTWDAQADHAISKSKQILSAFKFLRKYLTESQFLKAASANYYGSVFYSSCVWFSSLKQIHKTKLTSIHFRMLRTAKRDYHMKLKRHELTQLCQRATPDQWTKFITASKVLKIIRDEQPAILYSKLQSTYYEERRHPGVGLFYDSARIKVGKQSIENRLIFMRGINYPWNVPGVKLNNDLIRIQMKKAFFDYLQLPNNKLDTCTSPLADQDLEWFFPLGEAFIINT